MSIHAEVELIVSMLATRNRMDARTTLLKAATSDALVTSPHKMATLAVLVAERFAERYAETGEKYGVIRTRYSATIRKNQSGEYVVRFSANGKPMGDAHTYYASDLDDAKGTRDSVLAKLEANAEW